MDKVAERGSKYSRNETQRPRARLANDEQSRRPSMKFDYNFVGSFFVCLSPDKIMILLERCAVFAAMGYSTNPALFAIFGICD